MIITYFFCIYLDIPSFIETTLSIFSQSKITTISSLIGYRGDMGVKGLRQLGLGTPAAWAIHEALEGMILSAKKMKQENVKPIQLQPSLSEWLNVTLKGNLFTFN